MGAIAKVEQQNGWTAEQVELVKRTICKGATDDEMQLFMHQCKRTGLDPFSRQIHAVKRWDGREKREVMTIQTGIDGYRLIADRTGKYAGNDDPVYDVDNAAHPNKATVTVWKLVENQRVPFTRSAKWAEFCQTTKDGELNRFWKRMPYLMLGKVAEALALRAAFPQELSGLYTHEEMGQADSEPEALPPPRSHPKLPGSAAEHVEPQHAPQKPPKQNGHAMPANGLELRERLGKYDAQLSEQKVIAKGDLLSHLSREGNNQGWSDDLATWDDPDQISFAVEETKRYVEGRQRAKAVKPASPDPTNGVQLANRVRELSVSLHTREYTTGEYDLVDHMDEWMKARSYPGNLQDTSAEQVAAAWAEAKRWADERRNPVAATA